MGFNIRRPFHRSTTSEVTSVEGSEPSNEDTKNSNELPGKSTTGDAKVSGAEVVTELTEFKKLHQWDPNLPEGIQTEVDNALRTGDLEEELALDHELNQEDSIYPEVRAAVRNYDEDVPANTFRAWFIGMIFTTFGSGINMLFSMRSPSVYISIIVVQAVTYPIGLAMARWLPTRVFNTFGYRWTLNPGPFSIKEHAIIVIMANASWGGGVAYSTDVLLAQEVHYGQNFGWGFQILLTLTCQILGYGMAGVARRWLVWPAAMIWPGNFVNTVLFYGLHDHSPSDPAKTNGWKIGRYRFFLIVFAASFVWAWIPTWFASFLSVFTFVCWFKPNNAVVQQIFGGQTGIGLIPLTFDWNYVSGFISSPLPTPWFAIANTTIGLVIFFIIGSAGIHFSGAWYSKWLPMSSTGSYDNTGSVYNVTRILTPEFTLDEQAYQDYSPIFLSTTFALAYGISFATVAAVIVHTALFNGQEIWQRATASRSEEPDIHAKLMLKYEEAPDWWYGVMYITLFAVGIVTCTAWDTHLDWWAFILSQIIALVFIIPIGMIQAVTNIQMGLNVLTEFIIGYMLPGRPLAMMMFKMFGYITMSQALAFCGDLKLAHYLKLPPRTVFWSQVVATAWSSIIQIAVMNWALGHIDGVCISGQKDHYTCPNAQVFYVASILWGLIGPARVFGPNSPVYHASMWFFLLGALTPALIYVVARLYPRSGARYLYAPVIFGGTGAIPPATTLNYGAWAIIGYVFNKYIKDRYRGWWSRYNYITSAALDTGLFLALIVIFFALQLTNHEVPNWWGNNIINTVGDGQAITQATVSGNETFGPTVWN